MVFKRYIHKHGKKLGPYYYQNIRSQDGKVKTIYVGTNPHNHPKHRIRKPLLFLILALALILILGSLLFFLQNKSYLLKKVVVQEPDFDVDQILVKVLVRSNEFLIKQLRVMNIGSNQATVKIESSGLEDIVKVDVPSFTIKPGQTKTVNLNFTSYIPEQNIEQHPGIYVGKLIVKSEKVSKEIPIIVEIETQNVLFDMNLNPVAIERNVNQGSETTIEVRLFNLESIESSNVDVEYFVKDTNGNTIVTESETVVVKTQASFFKTISIPKNLKPGPYIFAAQAKFGNSVGTSSYLFYVVNPNSEESSFVQFCKNNILCLGISLTTILLLFALTAYFYFFIGAYLYEKVTGKLVAQGERRQKDIAQMKPEEIKDMQKMSTLDKVLDTIKKWKKKRERRAKEKSVLQIAIEENEARKRDEEIKRKELQKTRKREERQKQLRDFLHRIGLHKTQEEKMQIALLKEKKRQEWLRRQEELRKQKELEKKLDKKEKIKAVEERIRLEQEIKLKKEFSEKQRDQERFLRELKDELEKQKKQIEADKIFHERERKRIESEKRKNEITGEKKREEIRKKAKAFFHKIGFYKTPEEKRQIALLREKQEQSELKIKEGIRKQKDLAKKIREQQRIAAEKEAHLEAQRRKLEGEKTKQEEQRRQLEAKRQKELYLQNLEEEKIRKGEELRRKKELEEKQRQEEAKRRQLEEERRKQEELRKQEEARKQKELERKRSDEEKKAREEELRQQRENEARKRDEEIKRKELQKTRKREERQKQLRDFLHRIGLHKTQEEKMQIALLKEKKRQEWLRRQEELRKQKELENQLKEQQRIAAEKKAQLENRRLKLEEKEIKKEELERQETERKQRELDNIKIERERRRKQIEEENRKKEEQRRQLEAKRQKELYLQNLEEEKIRKGEDLRRKKELEEKQRQEEAKRRQLEEGRRKQEELRKQEEARKQKELERKRSDEEKKAREEELRQQRENEARKRDEEIKRKELTKQKEEQEKAKINNDIKEIEALLRKNREHADQLNTQIRKLSSEKEFLSIESKNIDGKTKEAEHEILKRSEHNHVLNLKKISLSERFRKDISDLEKRENSEDISKKSKIKELKSQLEKKRNALMSDLERELSKLTPAKRKAAEKWKRLEIKARLKLEEQKLEDELRSLDNKFNQEKLRVEDEYRKQLKELNSEQRQLKDPIAALKEHNEKILLEKNKIAKDILRKDKELEKLHQQLEIASKEKYHLNLELEKYKSAMSKYGLGLFTRLLSRYENKALEIKREEKIQEGRKEKQEPSKIEKKEKYQEKKPSGDIEELEEAIKKLGLFKKVENEKSGIHGKQTGELTKEKKPNLFGSIFRKENQVIKNVGIKEHVRDKIKGSEMQKEVPQTLLFEEKIRGKSRNFEKCYKALHDARTAIEKNDIPKANNLYVEARNIYIGLDYNEKKEVYHELMEMYNRLLK